MLAFFSRINVRISAFHTMNAELSLPLQKHLVMWHVDEDQFYPGVNYILKHK